VVTVDLVSDRAEAAALGIVLDRPDYAARVFARVQPGQFTGPHMLIAEAIHGMRVKQTPIDHTTLAAEMQRRGTLSRAGGLGYIASLKGAYSAVDIVDAYVDEIVTLVRRRSVWKSGGQAQQLAAAQDADPVDVAKVMVGEFQGIVDAAATDDDFPPVRSMREFLDVEEAPYDWVVPGLLERADRMILTGPEGIGKSELFRQIGVATGAGVHPFTHNPIKPQRVLFIDCENVEPQIRRALRRLNAVTRRLSVSAEDTVFIEARPEGLDLQKPEDEAWFLRVVTEVQPDLLMTGSLYRLHTADPSDETAARCVTRVIDRARSASGCAVVIEAHTGHSIGSEGARHVRPIGSSLWLRWPEFGYGLRPTKDFDYSTRVVDFVPFRGDRSEREWPRRLKAGGTWPWAVATHDEYNAAADRWAG
jgi:hypothetical protein